MKKFIFVVHNHQPVGNFDNVIRDAFEKSYRPFIDLVYDLKYPKVCFHFSGILYDWLEKNEQEYLIKLKEMVRRDQIEILSGGYYEPVLGVIPERDREAQIKKMNDYISRRFGVSPKGLWLTERVFNTTIPETLKKSGIEYTLVDDTHLLTSGIKESESNSCFTTEYNGKKIYIFTINHNLRYLIPYKEPYRTVEYINGFDDGIFVMADDGEKFGLWPESYRLVYENKWLLNFFETIKNSGIEMSRLCDCIDEKPKKLVYIPNTSYFELSQWALEAEEQNSIENFRENTSQELKKFVRGGFFENFFTKYRQSNLMHKRTFYVSSLVEDSYDPEAENYLHMAECNCGWWHGVFGGVYLPHIRMAVYENLLKAQDIIFKKKKKGIDIKNMDIDFDGQDDILIESKNNFFIVSPSYGGSLTEFSSKNKYVNLSAVMDRKKEAYHLKPPKDINGKNMGEEIKSSLSYDWHHRASLIDHFVAPDTSINDFMTVKYWEVGDFIPQPYSFSTSISKDGAEIMLQRSGISWDGDKKIFIDLSKKIIIDSKKDGFRAKYSIKNSSNFKANIFYVSELVFAFSSPAVAAQRDVMDIREYIFYDRVRGNIKLTFSLPVKLWIIPIETVSNSEGGIEKTYQGAIVACGIKREYEAAEVVEFDMGVEVL
jgi:alpha-amylase/alpha-mannosidase (GH57 family)